MSIAWIESDRAASEIFQRAVDALRSRARAQDSFVLWAGVCAICAGAAILGADPDEFFGPLLGPLNFGSICYWGILGSGSAASFFLGRSRAGAARARMLLAALRCPPASLDAGVAKRAPQGAEGDAARRALALFHALRASQA